MQKIGQEQQGFSTKKAFRVESDNAAAKHSSDAEMEVTYLSAESAGVLGMLADFNLLHLLTQRGTVTGTVFAHDSYLRRE